MASSSQPPQLHQETFSEDLNPSGLVTAVEEVMPEKDAMQDDDAKDGHTNRKVKTGKTLPKDHAE